MQSDEEDGGKILNMPKSKAFSDGKLQMNQIICFWKGRKYCGEKKRREWWLQAFSSIPKMLSRESKSIIICQRIKNKMLHD